MLSNTALFALLKPEHFQALGSHGAREASVLALQGRTPAQPWPCVPNSQTSWWAPELAFGGCMTWGPVG